MNIMLIYLFFLHIPQSLLNVWILDCLKLKQFWKDFEKCKMPLSLKKTSFETISSYV